MGVCAIPVFFVNVHTNAIPWFPIELGFRGIVGIVLLWAVVDMRPAIAVGLCFQPSYMLGVFWPPGGLNTPGIGQAVILALIAAALATGALLARKNAARPARP
jgi:hypothetical protein